MYALKYYLYIVEMSDTYLKMWLWLFFKVFFTRKYIKIIYIFYFLKIIFDISILK